MNTQKAACTFGKQKLQAAFLCNQHLHRFTLNHIFYRAFLR
ncbi:hypothetical protein HMPREF0476_1378 [Kingella kingae ATCC 23330]|uniref:Uncharacterized protein n=1 Tax=Kingella kingae ATCC 23330 TaxID=887327 RepID=F5S845_KINKI|nr:hypothetical protein HMPREF0476_1378 [Kingella kingae ATCC 23330]